MLSHTMSLSTVCRMRIPLSVGAALALSPLLATSQLIPHWAGPDLDPLLPLGGIPLVQNVSLTYLFRSAPPLGTFNAIPHIDFHDRQFLVSWQNKLEPNISDPINSLYTIYYSQSMDGETWTPTDGTNILFPNLTFTPGVGVPYSAALAPLATLHINGTFYAACALVYPVSLYPDPFQNQNLLLLRKIITPGLNNFGPLFWAANSVPPGFSPASQEAGIVLLTQMDAQTQADIATLSNWAVYPCGSGATGTLKCEAVLNGYPSVNLPTVAGTPSIYHVPNSGPDVLLYSSHGGAEFLQYSMRATPSGQWSVPAQSTIPDANHFRDAGVLSDGRVFIVSNSMPNVIYDPLYISTSVDGYAFNHTMTLTSCSLPYFIAPDQPTGCLSRYNLLESELGVHSPDALMVTTPGFSGLWVVFSLNGEDIWLIKVPVANI
jgi:hypothetical protein